MKEVNMQEILGRWLAGRLENMHTSMPAVVQSYEGHKTRRAVILPGVHYRSTNGVVIPYPPIMGVPVVFPSTPRFSFVYDLKKGDTGLLLFSESSMGNWLDGEGKPMDPEDASRFSMADAIFIPGLFAWNATPTNTLPDSGAVLDYQGTHIEFKADGGLSLTHKDGCAIVVESSKVTINGNLEVLK